MSEHKKHNFELEDRDYSAAELAEMTGRNKSRIHQIAREFNLGENVTIGKMQIRLFSKSDVNYLLNWLAENGQPRNNATDTDHRFGSVR